MRFLSRWLHNPTFLATGVLALLFIVAACGDGDSNGGEVDPTNEGTETVTAGNFAEECQPTGEKQFSQAPDMIIDTSKTYTATIKMANGDIVVELFSDVPITTNNFVFLSCKGFYDGVTFHRVLPGFMAQGGDPTGTGSGGPGYAIPDELDGDHAFDAGVISMANSGPNSAGSQFFITYTPQPDLAANFPVFGRVIEGMDVLEAITPRDPNQNPTEPGDAIETITIEES